MPVIKRYPNRKLYDTEEKQYITLDGIAALIRDGQDVTVIDHATSEDLTALTLSQVVFEQQKKHSGYLPYSVLTGLIQAGGETLGTLRRSLSSALGLARFVDEEIDRRVQRLVNQGDLTQDEGQLLLEKLLAPEQRFSDSALPGEHELEKFLQDRGVPTRSEIQRILTQLDGLAEKIERLSQNEDSP
jgi:polyhydroxyalkanoate synthesis repressor PhaR